MNFHSAQDKRRRALRNVITAPIDFSESPAPQASIDLNRFPVPSQVPLSDMEVDSPSSLSEIRNTVEVDNMLGFEVDVDNPVLKEVFGDDGENQIIQWILWFFRGLGEKHKVDWVRRLQSDHNLCMIDIQESKLGESTLPLTAASCWGDTDCRFEQVFTTGRSDGLVSIWDSKMFSLVETINPGTSLWH